MKKTKATLKEVISQGVQMGEFKSFYEEQPDYKKYKKTMAISRLTKSRHVAIPAANAFRMARHVTGNAKRAIKHRRLK